MKKLTPQILEEFLCSGTIITVDEKTLLIGYGKRKWSAVPERNEAPNFYFPDFFLKIGYPWFTHQNYLLLGYEDILGLLKMNRGEASIKWTCSCKSIFENAFSELQQKFKENKLIKAVPYIFEISKEKMTNDRLRQSLHTIINYALHHPVHVYGLWDNGEGFLGATPELLFDLDENLNLETAVQRDKVMQDSDSKDCVNLSPLTAVSRLKTVACAGTYETGTDFNSDAKLLYEHQLVIQGIADSLNPFGQIEIGPLKHTSFSALTHLITEIEVKLSKKLDFAAIVRALHPTPALGALPKKEGMKWLEQYQMQLPRRRFGAPVGVLRGDSGKCVIAIRNVQWDAFGMLVGAGCGIVPESQLESEWQELQLKLKATKDLLNL